MAKYVIEDTTLTGIADAIRGKTGGADPIPVTDMATEIAAITAGGTSGGSSGGSVEGIVYVTFMNGDVELCKTACMVGDCSIDPVECAKIATPTKEPTVDTVYTYSGWSLTAGGAADVTALVDVSEDRVVYAAYTESVREYTINFYDGETLLESLQVPYGEVPVPSAHGKENYALKGWEPELAAVTGDADYIAVWEDLNTIADDWDTIIASVNDGTYATKYEIGQCKTLDLGTLGAVNMEIVALDRTPLSDGSGNAAITWIAKELLNTPQVINSTAYDGNETTGTGAYGGWLYCELKTYCNETVLAAMPTAVQNALKSVALTYGQYLYHPWYASWQWLTGTSNDKVWVPSTYELCGTTAGYCEDSGVRYQEVYSEYPYVKTTPDGVARYWWLRTQINNSTANFYCVTDNGTPLNRMATSELYVCIGFCI